MQSVDSAARAPFLMPPPTSLSSPMPFATQKQQQQSTMAPPRIGLSRDVSSVHPVFFSSKLRRMPFTYDVSRTNPVALGYAVPEVQRMTGARL